MLKIWKKCSSLTSLNFSNFNTNNFENMGDMLSAINKGCNLICNNNKILNIFG